MPPDRSDVKDEVDAVFTVVIAEKAYIDSIQEYQIFLKPFIDKEKMAFCQWDPDGRTLAASVPTLAAAVARREHWRAVVVCGDAGLNQKNPFHLVRYSAPDETEEDPETDARGAEPEEAEAETTPEEDDLPDEADAPCFTAPEKLAETERKRRYLSRVFEAKKAAYEAAAEKPLTRLMTYLCELPMVSEGKNGAARDVEFAAYQAEALCKQEIRRRILGDEKIDFFLPQEIYCIAKRTCTEPEYDVSTAWTPHLEHQYSRFYDWNLYFDKMRYLVFDILPCNHQNYIFDYIRFLYTLLLFAGNEVPAGCLRPNWVYSLNSENDETALRRLISSYDEKLHNTELALEEEIRQLREKAKERISDYEANALYCSPVSVPVTLDQAFDQSGLYVDKRGYGLSADCPVTEEAVWDAGYRKSEKTLYKLVKQPQRSLKRATENLRGMNEADTDRVRLLNSFQMEDVREFASDAEMGMVTTRTTDIYDLTRYREQMEKEDKAVREKIETRMTRRTTLILGAAVLAVYLLCLLPLLIDNRADGESVALSLAMMGIAAVLLLMTGLVCLFFLRRALVKRVSRFNGVMKGISDEISDSLLQFSRYLSHACNMMRSYSTINFYSEHEDADTLQIRVRKKHMADIRAYRERLHEIFGERFTDPACADPVLSEAYTYNFGRSVDFDYSVPFMPGENRQIEYMQPGNEITVPVNFVTRLTVRQEELYD